MCQTCPASHLLLPELKRPRSVHKLLRPSVAAQLQGCRADLDRAAGEPAAVPPYQPSGAGRAPRLGLAAAFEAAQCLGLHFYGTFA